MAERDKAARPEYPVERAEETRKGLDQVAAVEPQADVMSFEDAVALAEPPIQSAVEPTVPDATPDATE